MLRILLVSLTLLFAGKAQSAFISCARRMAALR